MKEASAEYPDSLVAVSDKELSYKNLCRLRRIFLRECQGGILVVAGYDGDFPLVLSEK